jgi:cephalosporin hydroxylase
VSPARRIKNWIYDWRAAGDCRVSIALLRRLEYRLPTVSARFAVPWTFSGRGHCKHLTAYQHPVEIWSLYQRVTALAPRRVVEVGTARGGTLYLWTQAAVDDAVIVSIDLPEGPFGGGYRACRAPLYRAFARTGQRLTLIRDNAHDCAVCERVSAMLDGEGIDFLFIDADHSLPGICANLSLYGPLVAKGGLIALHDILPNPRWPEIEIWKLWHALRGLDDVTEITDSAECGRPLGIGLIPIGAAGFRPVREVIDDVRG